MSPLPRVAGLFLALALSILVGPAWAEEDELSFGLEGSLVLPAFDTQDSTAFALATWGVGTYAQLGLFDDLFLQFRGQFSTFDAAVDTSKPYRGRELDGQLRFASTHVHLELGARYKFVPGYDLALHVEAFTGLLWSIYSNQIFVHESGKSFGLDIQDFSEGGLTLSVGLAFDYRLFNIFFVGAAVRYVQVIGAMYQRHLSCPIQFSYYW